MKQSRRVVVTGIAVTAGALWAGIGAVAAGPGDLATGSASNQFPTPAGPGSSRLSAAAHSGPSGLDPRGNVHAKGTTGTPMGEFEVQGPVTCLRVDGNRAAIKYRFRRATGSAAPFQGGGVEVFIEDNGEPRKGQPVDATAFGPPQPAGVFDANASQCADPNTQTYDQVTSGNYEVRDRAVSP
jgi:hypothetical protein